MPSDVRIAWPDDRPGRQLFSASGALGVLLLVASPSEAAPQIRMHDGNRVPVCVTPERLMAFVRARNPNLLPKFADIAAHYRHWGEAWRVRWDYAFYQMVIETNALKFRRGNGQRGDVHERQNNFAGIGATGGGVPGDYFPDVSTGVHAQIQHLVAYSGVPVRQPIAPRTAKVQDHIVALSRRLSRPVTFADLAKRWAVDPAYGRSIATIAAEFEGRYCRGQNAGSTADVAPTAQRPTARRLLRSFPMPSGLGGPKPAPETLEIAIADPEADLPWKPGVAPSASQAADWTSAKSEPYDGPMPVRTIWSRDAALNTPPTSNRALTANSSEPSTTALPTPASAPSEAASSTGSFFDFATGGLFGGAGGSDRPLMSWFKIGPTEPEPSKLGGPVPDPAPLPWHKPAKQPVDRPQVRDENDAPIAGQPTTAVVPAWPEATVTPALSAPPPKTTAAINTVPTTKPPPQVATVAVRPPPPPAADSACKIIEASYGGKTTMLLSSKLDGVDRLIALTVVDGFERAMYETYVRAAAPGATLIGTYDSVEAALADARHNCPNG